MNKSLHWSEEDVARIQLTSSCRDCDYLPKVDGAGECFGEKLEFQRMHNGVVIRRGSYHGEWMTEVIQNLQGHHEPQEEKVFAEVLACLKPGATMVELGSFWAYYSMWFQRAVPDGKTILIEPNADKLVIGQEHLALNGMDGIFIRGFIGAEPLEVARFMDWDGKTYEIKQVAVDDMMRQLKLDTIDVLHADVQGAEHDMLLGATDALANHKIGYLFISTHGCEHGRCLKMLDKYGYRVIAQHTVLESYSGDGLIVAAAPDRDKPETVQISHRNAGLWRRIHYSLACLKRTILGQS